MSDWRKPLGQFLVEHTLRAFTTVCECATCVDARAALAAPAQPPGEETADERIDRLCDENATLLDNLAAAEKRIGELGREKLLWDEYDVKDRAKTREINILTKEVKDADDLLRECEEAFQAQLDGTANCGNPIAECPLQDAHKPDGIAGLVTRLAARREGKADE